MGISTDLATSSPAQHYFSLQRARTERTKTDTRATRETATSRQRTSLIEITTNMLDHASGKQLFGILLALLCFCQQIPGTCANKTLQLEPQRIVVLFESPASANCSTNATHHGLGWEASQGAVDRMENVQLITWTVDSLTHWDIQPICYVIITADEQKLLSLDITVYKPPDRVSISTVDHTGPMIEGRQYELQCNVENVAPVHLLTVNWYKGPDLVESKRFSDGNKFPVNINMTLQISPNRADNGVLYRCVAELNLGPEGPQPPPLMESESLNITVHFGPEISNCPSRVLLKEGESLLGYCNVAGNPYPSVRWESMGLTIDPTTTFYRTSGGEYNITINSNIALTVMVEVMYGPEISCEHYYTIKEGDVFSPNCTIKGFPETQIFLYKDGEVVNFSQQMYRDDAGQYILIANNINSIVNHTLEIDVTYPPTEILELEDETVSVGDNLVLKCSSNAIPRPKYEWIYHQTSNVKRTDEDGISLLHINRASGDNIGTYMCIASNYLDNKNKTVRVEVQGAKATCPLSISPQRVVLEYGESQRVTCSSSTQNANLSWRFLNNVLNLNTLDINSSFFFNNPNFNGKFSCLGIFKGLDACQTDINVTIYKRPDKVSISALDHANHMTEGNNYTLLCDFQNVAPVQLITVNWYKGQHLLKTATFNEVPNPTNTSTTIKIVPNRNDNITQYSCEVVLKLESGEVKFRMKSETLNLTVHYKPTITPTLPSRVPLFRGYPVKLLCEARGYPEPTIEWISNNVTVVSTPNGTLSLDERNVSRDGVYTCIAKNSLSSDTRVVSVVLTDASCKLVLRPPELMVEYGASASVDCSTPSIHTGIRWEAPQGKVEMVKDVQLITWKVDSLVHWDIQPVCFLNTVAGQCHMKLPVTVYKHPDQVSISIVGDTGRMIEGKQYELQCDVYNFAPVHLLNVNWYKGQHMVAKTNFYDSTKTPANQSTRHHMFPRRADDGVCYRCEAELKPSGMGTGTQLFSIQASQDLCLNVHYSPQFTNVIEIFNETTETIKLNCTVMANPPPHYIWTSTNLWKEFDKGQPVLILSPLDSGNYTCMAWNEMGSSSKLFIVQVKHRGGGSRTVFWAIVGPFLGLAVVMIVGYVLVRKRTIKK
ncbi:hemicentin-1-like isoform X1 [Clarias gariepinus]|uniref:hemicentin-1-like isoform X1 n=2 Tax=Clarias gariepinus TaxID=13013 RepID=UPI00234CF150|nr:hemicentin-1-like isoform X1 [Clarias gariepinus]